MKKNILVLSLFAGVLANLLVSCSNDDETTNQALLEGKWELSQIYVLDDVLDNDEFLKDEVSYPSKERPTTQYCKLYITKSTQFEYEFLYNYGVLYKPYDMSSEDYDNYAASGKWTIDDFVWNTVKCSYLVDGDKVQLEKIINNSYNDMFSPIAFAHNATIVKLDKDEFTYKENVIYSFKENVINSENSEKIDVYYKFTRMK